MQTPATAIHQRLTEGINLPALFNAKERCSLPFWHR
jgi:hypothetical protein